MTSMLSTESSKTMVPAAGRMLSPSEIYENFDALAQQKLVGGAFGLALMEAVGAPRVTITKLKDDAATGAFSWTRMLRFETVPLGAADRTLERMKVEAAAASKTKRPRLLVAYDGEGLAAHDTKIGDDIHEGIDVLPMEAEFFFPLGGHERYVPAPDRQADVRATKHISRFFDAVRDANPTWATDADRHALNLFMVRVLFCLFAEDVGIFDAELFTSALNRSTQVDGTDLGMFLSGAFAHMKNEPAKRAKGTHGWSKLPWVNGGLFEEDTAMPALDSRCRKQMIACTKLNWRTINPDIFGSMLQAVVDIEKRGEMGMHYTSPSNIAKVLDPILLDALRAELEKAGSNKGRLHDLLNRLGRIRMFDPACGSGNFLILAYKALREIEMEIFIRLGEYAHPVVKLEHFYGIEIDDFACQTARLGLWIAEYQVNENFRQKMGKAPPALPLTAAGRITRANSARADWLVACPPDAAMETYVVGNPPFKGSKHQTADQRADMIAVFQGKVLNFGELDYVAIWFLKGALYAEVTGSPFAFVSTNSIVQGASVPTIWPRILKQLEIQFAHRSFKWSNLAARNAGVTCVIVGVGPTSSAQKRIFDAETVRAVDLVGPYLAPNVSTIVAKRTRPLSDDAGTMQFGNMPNNGEALLLDRNDKSDLVTHHPGAESFIRRLYGGQELIKGVERWCIWVRPVEVEAAAAIEPLANRFNVVRQKRLKSSRVQSVRLADRPWAFDPQNEAQSHTIMVPRISSENRGWLPIDIKPADAISHDQLFAIYDGSIWQASILSSRLHRLWLDVIGGKLEDRLRYSNQLIWNTFPIPKLSDRRKDDLEEHWWEIDRARKEAGFGRTLGDLYAPKTMPPDLRRAHEDLDETVEVIFGSRKYRSDADRIEHMLQLYERAIADETGKRA
ncbi:class I SAM-dependent DNA methyltransferase [Methylobacterium sp. WL122]|nr:class I SAM-dependent DNA methyltransferase [Methylobacterium sp. WL122]